MATPKTSPHAQADHVEDRFHGNLTDLCDLATAHGRLVEEAGGHVLVAVPDPDDPDEQHIVLVRTHPKGVDSVEWVAEPEFAPERASAYFECLRRERPATPQATEAPRHGATAARPDDRPLVVPVGDFIAIERPPLEPYIASSDGECVLLAIENTLLIASPSGLGKTLAFIDLASLLAGDGGMWLGTQVRGGLRVLLVLLEGSDEDTADRLRTLIPASARQRLYVLDRWRGPSLRADERGIAELADLIARHEIDVLLIDTLPAWLSE